MHSRSKPKAKQPTIGNFFFSKPSKTKQTSAAKENTLPAVPDLAPPPSAAHHELSQANAKPRQIPTVKPSSWWVTPPRGEKSLPGARKRTESGPMPTLAKRLRSEGSFNLDSDIPSITSSSANGQVPLASRESSLTTGVQPASRTNSRNGGPPWQARAKPLVRPSGIASTGRKASQPSIINALLSDEQKHVLRLVLEDQQSIFFTGAAGTGKSHILRQIVETLRRNRYESEVAVTATTGLAAFNIGGKTLHRWAGIRTGEDSPAGMVSNIKKNRETRDAWRRCKVLIIDEVSMLDATLLDKLEEVARLLKGNDKPFGGIQVVLTGDFFQLPPVGRSSAANPQGPPLCFEAKSWASVVHQSIVLTKVFRQEDNKLIDMLNAMRTGNLSPEMVQQFEALSRPVKYSDGLEATELYPVRWQVDKANSQRLMALPGSLFTFEAYDSSTFDSAQKVFEQLLAPKKLELKINAQVLLIRNLNDVLVNGRRGHVVTLISELEWQVLGPFLRDHPRALELYNAKMNAKAADPTDMTHDEAHIYTQINDLTFPDETVKAHYLAALESSLRTKLPVVDFRGGQVVLIDRVEFSIESGNGTYKVSREQLPLVPSWALSIHKSQGQTLDRVVVDLSQVFEAGQAYVAVSRATSYDKLQIKGFKKEKVRVHPRVAQFYQEIESEPLFI